MPSFGEARDALLFSLSEIKIIKDKEFLLLHDLNKSKNRDFDYQLFIEVNLQDVSDEHCLSEFRFTKNDRKKLRDALQLPLEIIYRLYNNNFADSGEASCILLRRQAYPCRYSDIPRFARPVQQLCMVFNEMLDIIDSRWGFLLQDLNQRWLDRLNLKTFAEAVQRKGAFLDNV